MSLAITLAPAVVAPPRTVLNHRRPPLLRATPVVSTAVILARGVQHRRRQLSRRFRLTMTESAVAPTGDCEEPVLVAPRAEAPAAPSRVGAIQLSDSPDFSVYAGTLTDQQEVSRRLQDITSSGRQLSWLALARLQRSETEGAAAALAAVRALPTLQEAMGQERWAMPEKRVRLCQHCGVGGFLETYIASLALLSFLEQGVLTPQTPESWVIGVQDYDDEMYLLGVINSVRELERYAVNRGQELDLRSVRLCLGAAQCLEEALMQFSFRNSDLRQRFDGVKYTVKKLESLAYEIDLARQRAAAAAGPTSKSAAAQTSQPDSAAPGAVDLELIGKMKVRYEAFDEQRETVMKRSRDIGKAAKNAIYALHREDYRKADSFLKQCVKDATEIYDTVVINYPRLRDGFFSATLEEFVEALVYRAFRQEQQLLSLQQVQEGSSLRFPFSINEYLGGIMDLTGEVCRFAIRSASGGRQAKDKVELSLACVDAVYNGLQELPLLPGQLGKKMRPLKSTLTKVETALYELALLSQGVSSRPPDIEEGTDALDE